MTKEHADLLGFLLIVIVCQLSSMGVTLTKIKKELEKINKEVL